MPQKGPEQSQCTPHDPEHVGAGGKQQHDRAPELRADLEAEEDQRRQQQADRQRPHAGILKAPQAPQTPQTPQTPQAVNLIERNEISTDKPTHSAAGAFSRSPTR